MTNKQLIERATKAIMDLFSDRSVSKEEAIINLGSLRDEIEMLIESLES
jgi:hypothetical protein